MTKTKRNATARYETAKKLVRGSKLVMRKFYDAHSTGRMLKVSWSLWGGVNEKTGYAGARKLRRKLRQLADRTELNAGGGYRAYVKDVFLFIGATPAKKGGK